jgi:20S proteasome alpha/beta subunit
MYRNQRVIGTTMRRRPLLTGWKLYVLAGASFYAVLLLLLTVTSFALDTAVKTKSGTIVVFGLSKNKIVVAAESRSTGEESGDHQCKIITFDDRSVFASNGLAGAWIELISPPSKRIVIMDANKEARIAFGSVPLIANDSLRKVALQWGRNVSHKLNAAIVKYGLQSVFGSRTKNPVVNGYFFGLSPKGVLVLYMENILRHGNDVSFDSEPKAISLTDTMGYSGQGLFSDSIAELAQGKTDWAKREAIRRQSRLAIAPKDDWDVLTAVSLIQSVLDAHSDSREVGGPIDSLTVTPVGIRWYTQKKECQNQH